MNTTTIFVGSLQKSLANPDNQDNSTLDIQESVDEEITQVALHETSHAIDLMRLGEKQLIREATRHYDKHSSMPFAARVLLKTMRLMGDYSNATRIRLGATSSGHAAYLQEPGERRAQLFSEAQLQKCRAEAEYPVTVSFKSP
jgi:hypothetical protein